MKCHEGLLNLPAMFDSEIVRSMNPLSYCVVSLVTEDAGLDW
jgi:hypothetical protein